jgi:prepilin-type N-terminal cleavage/methylation domain-containing protein
MLPFATRSGCSRHARQARGMTLVEVMVAAAILAVAMLGIYTLIFASMKSAELSQQRNIATFNLNSAAGYVRSIPLKARMDPAYLSGQPCIPHASVIDTELYSHVGEAGTTMTNLTNQQITILYRATAPWLNATGKYTWLDKLDGTGTYFKTDYASLPLPGADGKYRPCLDGKYLFYPLPMTTAAYPSFVTPDPLRYRIVCSWNAEGGGGTSMAMECISTEKSPDDPDATQIEVEDPKDLDESGDQN